MQVSIEAYKLIKANRYYTFSRDKEDSSASELVAVLGVVKR